MIQLGVADDGVGMPAELDVAATDSLGLKLVKSGFIKPAESVVLILTGHVLKDPEYTIKFHRGDLSVPRMADDKFHALTRSHRKAPVVLDASPDAVLHALEAEEKGNG